VCFAESICFATASGQSVVGTYEHCIRAHWQHAHLTQMRGTRIGARLVDARKTPVNAYGACVIVAVDALITHLLVFALLLAVRRVKRASMLGTEAEERRFVLSSSVDLPDSDTALDLTCVATAVLVVRALDLHFAPSAALIIEFTARRRHFPTKPQLQHGIHAIL
jgi:hypothetical protein